MAKVELELFREPSGGGEEDPSEIAAPRILAVTGAKGGVGKSLLAANLGVYLATIGRRVVVVDADASSASVHGFLGLDHPRGIEPYDPPMPTFAGEAEEALPPTLVGIPAPKMLETPVAQPERLGVVDTQVPGLKLMHIGLDELPPGVTHAEVRAGLLKRLRALDTDFVVLDLGTGIEPSKLDLWLGSDLRLFIALPEPTAIEATYRFIRAAFTRSLSRRLEQEGRLGDLTLITNKGVAPSPPDLVAHLGSHPLRQEVEALMAEFELYFVLNQARVRGDLELGSAMVSASRRRLGLTLRDIGYIDFDDTVWNCLRKGRPLLVESPGTKASRAIEKIARSLLAHDGGKRRPPSLPNAPAHTHHDLLEVDRGATEEEIRRAYKRCREIYAPGSLAIAGLLDKQGLARLRSRIEEAHDVLLDPARRRPYELSVFPSDHIVEKRDELPAFDGPRPAAPSITPETDFTGPLLRAVRESQGVTLKEVANRTKIGLAYLKSIEDDRYSELPALVYVRGFVSEIAKCLRLDPLHVTRTYLNHYRRHRKDPL